MKVTVSGFNYCDEHFSVTSSDCVKGLGVVRKLHLFVLLNLLVCRLSVWSVFIALILSEREYASVLSINLTFTGSGKLENIQRNCSRDVVMYLFS